MYCRKCGKKISDDAKYCTICGAPTDVNGKKPKKNIAVRILLGIGAWFGGTILVALVGMSLGLGEDGQEIPGLYALAVVIVPVLLAFLVAAPEKLKLKTPPKQEQKKPVTTPAPMKSTPAPIPRESTAPTVPAEPAIASDPPKIAAISIRRTYRVAGVTFHTDEIEELAYENEDFELTKQELINEDMIGQKVWKYQFYPSTVDLEPEPDNPEDPRAIKVLVDGLHVGYIKSGSLGHLHKVMRKNRIEHIDCQIGGGPYKCVIEDYDDDTYKSTYTLERSEINYFVHLEVEESVS